MKKRVFISGVTGIMGGAGLRHLLEYKDSLDLVTIVRDSKNNRKKMDKFKDSINIIWGDLTHYDDVKTALKGVDYILHVAALVSPEADDKPELAWEINVGSIKNILKAIDDLNLKDVKLVYIGSVAETGSRLPPIHWGRVGDPIKPSIFDNYAVTKIAAERLVIESGLKYWVSLRQTGILYSGLLSMRDRIMFHQPLNNVLEWITDDDSGRMLANICIKDLPNTFWKNIYNVGGGESCRANNYQFTSSILQTIGVKDIKKIFEPNWFASKNFHGQYYLDSHVLNDYLDFREESLEDFGERLKMQVKFPTNLLKFMPNFFIKYFVMKIIAQSPNGTLNWIKTKNMEKINAYWGSLEKWREIGDWSDFHIQSDYSNILALDHGYDESKDEHLININDIKSAANFRGGECLSPTMVVGDLDTKLLWKCSFNHEFYASPRLVLKAGHWCQECAAPPWDDEEIAKQNPFFAQVME